MGQNWVPSICPIGLIGSGPIISVAWRYAASNPALFHGCASSSINQHSWSLNCHLFKTYSIKSISASFKQSFTIYLSMDWFVRDNLNRKAPWSKNGKITIWFPVCGFSQWKPIEFGDFPTMFAFPSLPQVSDLQALLSSEYRAVEAPGKNKVCAAGEVVSQRGSRMEDTAIPSSQKHLFFACSITHWVHVKGKFGC